MNNKWLLKTFCAILLLSAQLIDANPAPNPFMAPVLRKILTGQKILIEYLFLKLINSRNKQLIYHFVLSDSSNILQFQENL
jgi:hypothetical protein